MGSLWTLLAYNPARSSSDRLALAVRRYLELAVVAGHVGEPSSLAVSAGALELLNSATAVLESWKRTLKALEVGGGN